MEYFETHGSWFVPGGLRVNGTLSFSADGLALTTFGPLLPGSSAEDEATAQGRRRPVSPIKGRQPHSRNGLRMRQDGRKEAGVKWRRFRAWSGRRGKPRSQGRGKGKAVTFSTEWGTFPLIYGVDHDQRDITLVGSFGMLEQFPGITEQTFNVTLALVGQHLPNADFIGIQAEFDHLADWVNAPDIATVEKEPRTIRVNREATEIVRTLWEGATLTITSGITGQSDTEQIRLDRYCTFAAESSPQEWSELLDTYLRPFHDLLILCLGRPLRMTDVQLRPAGSDRWVEAYFSAIAPPQGQMKPSSIHSYNSPTLLTAMTAPMPLADLLPAWFNLHRRLKTVVTLLHAPFYAPFTYSEHRYASFFQSVEAYHKLEKDQFEGRELTRAEHRQRVREVVAALKASGLPDEHVRWAKNVIEGRNDKPLKAQVEEVVASTGVLGERVLRTVPSFSGAACDARTSVSHGAADKGVNTATRHWFGEVLLWVMRVRLLQHLGANDVDERALQRPSFGFALEQVASTSRLDG